MSTKADSFHPLGMSTSAAPMPQTAVRSTAVVPWYVWCGVAAVTSASIGGVWDVSWHRSIGRDSFWTAAHMAIYACGVLRSDCLRIPDLCDDLWQFGIPQANFGEGCSVFALRWAPLLPPGVASPCWPQRPSTTGGTTPMAST